MDFVIEATTCGADASFWSMGEPVLFNYVLHLQIALHCDGDHMGFRILYQY